MIKNDTRIYHISRLLNIRFSACCSFRSRHIDAYPLSHTIYRMAYPLSLTLYTPLTWKTPDGIRFSDLADGHWSWRQRQGREPPFPNKIQICINTSTYEQGRPYPNTRCDLNSSFSLQTPASLPILNISLTEFHGQKQINIFEIHDKVNITLQNLISRPISASGPSP